MAKSCLKSLGEDLEVSSIIQSREVLQAAGVEEVFVCCLTGAASHPGEGRRLAVHFGSCFEADSGDSISSQAFGWRSVWTDLFFIVCFRTWTVAFACYHIS